MPTLSFSTRLERLVYFILVYLLAFSTYQISGAYIFIKITRKIKDEDTSQTAVLVLVLAVRHLHHERMTHKGAEATSDSVPVLVSVAIAVAATYITHTYLLNFNLRGWRCRDPLEAKNKNQGLQGSVYQIVMASFPPYLLLYSGGERE